MVAAIHTAADAVNRVAAEDREAVRAAAADHRLYVPAFTRTNADVFRRYRAACPSRVDEILAPYDDAIATSTRATSKLDDLALVLDAPTWPLATLRAQLTQHPARLPARRDAFPRGPANSPPGPRSVGTRVKV